MAMHRASPTRISPSRRPGLSGRKAQERASCGVLVWVWDASDRCRGLDFGTMSKGATTQLMAMLNRICIQISRLRKTWWRVSNLILQRMGYIMTRSPTAFVGVLAFGQSSMKELWETCRLGWRRRRTCPFGGRG